MPVRHLQAERLVSEGVALYEHHQWREAHKRFLEAARLWPDSSEVRSNLAKAQEKFGELKLRRPKRTSARPFASILRRRNTSTTWVSS